VSSQVGYKIARGYGPWPVGILNPKPGIIVYEAAGLFQDQNEISLLGKLLPICVGV
jgi:hypothetical protein